MRKRIKWYDWSRWRRKARLQLQLEPLCALCLRHGVVEPAVVADHIVPHKGNEQAFWFGKLQSLCASCHSGAKAMVEHKGYDPTIGLDGFPVDPNHPFSRRA